MGIDAHPPAQSDEQDDRRHANRMDTRKPPPQRALQQPQQQNGTHERIEHMDRPRPRASKSARGVDQRCEKKPAWNIHERTNHISSKSCTAFAAPAIEKPNLVALFAAGGRRSVGTL